jgi:hypothetical protein
MDPDAVSEHGESVDSAPAGWVGGDLVHTGGNLFAREWIHPEKALRVGYSVDDPSRVGVEAVRFEGSGDKSTPRMWQRIRDVESEPCDREGDCLETARQLMRDIGTEQ